MQAVVDSVLDPGLSLTVKCASVAGYDSLQYSFLLAILQLTCRVEFSSVGCSADASDTTTTCVGCAGPETVTYSGSAAATVGGTCVALKAGICSCANTDTLTAT